ncbi:MAG: NfeD family protein [Paludibacteraceae bacterium]
MSEIFLIVLFMLLGIGFLLLELFLIPGISVGGFAGIAFVVASVWYAFATMSTTVGCITLACGLVTLSIAVWLFVRSRALDKMSLKAEVDSTSSAPKNTQVSLGERGITTSRLAPIGTARFDGVTLEVKSLDGLIDPNTDIEVVDVSGDTVSVRKTNN